MLIQNMALKHEIQNLLKNAKYPSALDIREERVK